MRCGHSNIAIGLDAQAFLNFEKAFELSKIIHNGEENGSCVIALMNMAIPMRFLGNEEKCSQILDKCMKIEETINGKQTDYYKRIKDMKEEVDQNIQEDKIEDFNWW